MKKIVSIIITICLLIILASTGIFSIKASAETYMEFTYKIVNNEVAITRCSDTGSSIDIPSEIDGYPVTRIYGVHLSIVIN